MTLKTIDVPKNRINKVYLCRNKNRLFRESQLMSLSPEYPNLLREWQQRGRSLSLVLKLNGIIQPRLYFQNGEFHDIVPRQNMDFLLPLFHEDRDVRDCIQIFLR